MITIQSGKLTIPEEDRFVGFAGDNSVCTKQFVLPDHGADSGSFSLCLRFDDDSVKVIPLAKSLSGSDMILTWNVQSAHLMKAGIVMAQVKYVDGEGVISHTCRDYFIAADTDDGGGEESEYVLRPELEDRLDALKAELADNAPYIGNDGYLYVYDLETAAYVRSGKASFVVDNAVIAGSANPVESRAIKAYVDSGLSGTVNKNTRIAGIALETDISRSELIDSIRSGINPPLVVPDSTVGYSGQFGKTYDDEPVMCLFSDLWVKLATEDDLNGRMAMAPTVNSGQIADIPTGQLFLCQGGIAVKLSSGYLELAKKSDVYTRSEINTMIGDLETVLSGV